MTVSEISIKKDRNEYARIWYSANKERICAKQRLKIKTREQKNNHNKASRKYYNNNKEKHHLLTKRYKDKLRSLKPPKQLKIKLIPVKKEKIKLTLNQIKEKERLRYYKRKSTIQKHNLENKIIINEKYRIHIAKRRKNDPLFKLRCNIRGLILISIKRYGFKKRSKTSDIIGCDWDTLKKHIEIQFETWMNWDNRGKYNGELKYGWDIDHIIPVSSAKTEEEMISLNHYTNLQPLDSYVNRHIKRNKVA